MENVVVSRIAEIPAETIWDEMKHFDRVLRWVPGGDKSCLLYTSPSPRDS